jgi:hypothetical protein
MEEPNIDRCRDAATGRPRHGASTEPHCILAARIIWLLDPVVLAHNRGRGGAAGAPTSAATVRFPSSVLLCCIREHFFALSRPRLGVGAPLPEIHAPAQGRFMKKLQRGETRSRDRKRCAHRRGGHEEERGRDGREQCGRVTQAQPESAR